MDNENKIMQNPDDCTHDCSSCLCDCEEEQFQNEQDVHLLNPRSKVKKTYAIASAKGGVGKSFITAVLACELAEKGYRVGIIDADLSGASLPLIFGSFNDEPADEEHILDAVEVRKNVFLMSLPLITQNPSSPVEWDELQYKGCAQQFYTDIVWDNIDFLLIDTPSQTSPVTQMFFEMPSINGTIIVSDPSENTAVITAKTMNLASKNKLEILGIIENYIDRESNSDINPFLSKTYNTPILDKIAFDADLYKAANLGLLAKQKTNLLKETVATLIDNL